MHALIPRNMLLTAALELASKGVPVFPCNLDKSPRTTHGYKNATTDPAQIRKWWTRWPDASIGVPTGRASGLLVLDVDLPKNENGRDGEAVLAALEVEHGQLPVTMEARTGSGGRHIFYRYPADQEVRDSANKIAKGLDVRGEGGYVIVAPSGHPSGRRYSWVRQEPLAQAPKWLIALAAQTPKDKTGSAIHPPMSMRGAGTTAYGRAALTAESENLVASPEGQRNTALNDAAFALGQLVAGGELDRREAEVALHDTALAIGLTEKETRKTIASGLNAGERSPRCAPQPHPRKLSRLGEHEASESETRPLIEVRQGDLALLTDECEQVLIDAGLPIYQRGGMLVRVAMLPEPATEHGVSRQAGALMLLPTTAPWLLDALGRAVRFVKYKPGAAVPPPCDAPHAVAQHLLARSGSWRFQPLRGILAGPALRHDGSVLNCKGYDPATGYYLSDTLPLAIPATPTKGDAKRALAKLRGLLVEFPFAIAVDESVALALLLTSVARPAIDHAPLFAVTAPIRGSGKSTLIDLASILATGGRAAVLAASGNAEEVDKRLTASILAGDSLISLDNLNSTLRNDMLNQALTQGRLRIRPLGSSERKEMECDALWCANGNNLVIAGDLTRRTLPCRLDPGCERPETRIFKGKPVAVLMAHRAEHVAAALTIMQAFHLAGRPHTSKLPPFGSFERWSSTVREALVWLDLPDPCDSMASLHDEDPDREFLSDFLMAWHEAIGEAEVTVRDLVESAQAMPSSAFHSMLQDAAGGQLADINTRRLASFLQANVGRIVNGLRLERSKNKTKGVYRWKVQVVEASRVG